MLDLPVGWNASGASSANCDSGTVGVTIAWPHLKRWCDVSKGLFLTPFHQENETLAHTKTSV